MKKTPLHQKLAVCSWSLQPEHPRQLVEQLKAIGLSRLQIALDPIRTQPDTWASLPALCAQNGLQLVSGMFGTVGEDYSTLESIRLTGGIVPDSTWEENWENIQTTAQLSQRLQLPLVTFHAGFLPHDESDPEFERLQHRIRLVADVFAARNIQLAFETGQETADSLKRFLDKLGRSNVGVNFDPANMLLYDKGNPIEALRTLKPWLLQCHLKDANRTRTPGTWGEEVVLGAGQVDWPAFFQTLLDQQFDGDLAIEREAGNQRLQDIQTASQFAQSILAGR